MIQLNNIELRRRKCNRERPCETCTTLGRPPVSYTYPVPEPGPPYATSSNDPPVSMEVNDEDSYRQLSTSKGPTTSAHTKYPTIVSQGTTRQSSANAFLPSVLDREVMLFYGEAGFLQLIAGRDINFTNIGQDSEVVNVQEEARKDPDLKAYYIIHNFPI
ncbi:unnamed protein product [Clonostachys chloroleuca]|uniref:Uncharacterized protein n=1 Tax=Clonostachys chloroleuca TaxID=1926264 RepID=A0AA35LQG2_9HYPO|nr:unnamed protein product [Clonostachys chloroleuca]